MDNAPERGSNLPEPSAHIRTAELPVRTLAIDRLWRVSRWTHGEPHFGRTGVHRFDGPPTLRRRFGVAYFGLNLLTAVAETLLHDEIAVDGGFRIAQADWASRHVLRFEGDLLLRLVDLTGAAAKRLGCDGRISTEVPPEVSQRWSAAIQSNPGRYDGIYYVSRQLNDQRAVALFDRSATVVRMSSAHPLAKQAGAARTLARLNIRLIAG